MRRRRGRQAWCAPLTVTLRQASGQLRHRGKPLEHETLRTWLKRGWVVLPRTSTTGDLKKGGTRVLDALSVRRLERTMALAEVGLAIREAWACSGVMDLADEADLESAVILMRRLRAAVHRKGAIRCRD